MRMDPHSSIAQDPTTLDQAAEASAAAAEALTASAPPSTNWLDVENASFALIAVFAALAGYFLTRRHFRVARTLEYIRAFNAPDMIPVRARVIAWAQKHGTDHGALVSEVEADPELRSMALAYVNLLTEFSVAYERGLVSRSVANEQWYPLLPEQWDLIRPWALSRRSKGYEMGAFIERVSMDVARANAEKEAKRKAGQPLTRIEP